MDDQFIPSPCIGVCSTHDGADVCAGCLRTAEEVTNWDELDATDQRACWRRIKAANRQVDPRHQARIERFKL